jgi:dihydrolipoamide dehydrogenase
VVLAHGVAPRIGELALDKAQVEIADDGSIGVNEQLRTSNERIFAVGDVTCGPMLANRAIHQGRTAAEIVAGHDSIYEPRAVPNVIFTDPPIAWCGLTEIQAVAQGIAHVVRRADWSASARAVSLSQADGLTKLIVDPESGLLLGMGIVGAMAPEMISHGALAIEMGAVVDDLAAIVHAHPSLSELIADAARG